MQKLIQDIHIGQNLQRLRKQRGLSQYDMAVKMELEGRAMSRATYAHIEQGIRNVFVSDMILFKRILDVNYDEFFQGLEPEKINNGIK